MIKNSMQAQICGDVSTMAQSTAIRSSRASFIAPLFFAGIAIIGASSAAQATEPNMARLGSPANSAARMITIDQSTRHVNVNAGDTVGFVTGDKNFHWNFDVASNVYMLDLNNIAPENALNHRVKVYVAPNLMSIF